MVIAGVLGDILSAPSGFHLGSGIRHHFGYGYAVTSHSTHGATAGRVLVHMDTEQARDQLVNSRLAYVSVSRGRYDAQIYTSKTV